MKRILILLDVATEHVISAPDVAGALQVDVGDLIVHRATEFESGQSPRGAPPDWKTGFAAVERAFKAARDIDDGTTGLPWVLSGRSALPLFYAAGRAASQFRPLTCVNRRSDGTWDVFDLGRRSPEGGEARPFEVTGLDEVRAEQRAVLAVSCGDATITREQSELFHKSLGLEDVPFVHVSRRGSMTSEVVPGMEAQLRGLVRDLVSKTRELTLLLAGPSPLAALVGRVLNKNQVKVPWVPNFEAGRYHFAFGDRPKRYSVALSFAGDQRERVDAIARLLAERLGQDHVFYDQWNEGPLSNPAGPDQLLDVYLNDSSLVVVMHSRAYGTNVFPRAELKELRRRLLECDPREVFLVNLDGSPIAPELERIAHPAFLARGNSRSDEELSRMIIERLDELRADA